MKALLTSIILTFLFTSLANAEESFSPFMISKATISQVMGTNPQIIKKDKEAGGVVFLSYKRSSDGKHFAYKCKIIGSKVIWGNATGRWRDSEYDSVLKYEVSGNKLTITERYTDGSGGSKTFTRDELN